MFLFVAQSRHESVHSCDDVSRWLQSMGGGCAAYVDAFKRDFVDGFWLLNYITNGHLQKYGVNDEGDRRIILDNIQKLKLSPSVKP